VAPPILITGFGPFPGVEHNPSAGLVRALEDRPPDGVRVQGVVLPVTFGGVAAAFDSALAAGSGAVPAAILSMGVHPGPEFRLERRARGRVESDRADASGASAQGLVLAGGEERETTLDLDGLASVLASGGAGRVVQSSDAGGYVCERTYHHALGRAVELDVPAVFLHVPALEHVPLADQEPPVRALVAALARLAGTTRSS
jgi:pyroglutamyl-peptidase